jgi:hypothetical protein
LIRKRTGSVHGIFSSGMGPETGFVSDLSPVLNSWRIPFLGDLTLREYGRDNPRDLLIR